MALAHVQRHGYFLKRSISGALADAVDGAFHLPRTGGDCSERIRYSQAQIVVAMGAINDFGVGREVLARATEHVAVFFGRGVADRVGHINDSGSVRGGGFDYFEEENKIGAAGVFRREFHFFAVLHAVADHRRDLLQRFTA